MLPNKFFTLTPRQIGTGGSWVAGCIAQGWLKFCWPGLVGTLGGLLWGAHKRFSAFWTVCSSTSTPPPHCQTSWAHPLNAMDCPHQCDTNQRRAPLANQLIRSSPVFVLHRHCLTNKDKIALRYCQFKYFSVISVNDIPTPIYEYESYTFTTSDLN